MMTISAHRAGSSPHARGLLRRRRDSPSWGGIIPACAGFTARVIATAGFRGDHPRMRGVYLMAGMGSGRLTGSSPHARGLLPDVVGVVAVGGIIPACAGFTCARPGGPRTPRDHPRMRGVYSATRVLSAQVAGSSPHARGLRRGSIRASRGRRIIPARAGFTSQGPLQRLLEGDHPRTRGVYLKPGKGRHHRRGSSPHARGLPAFGVGCEAQPRIIPAHAGFTPCEYV